jgi:putative glycosyl hydrolase-like family 6 (GHL6) protein
VSTTRREFVGSAVIGAAGLAAGAPSQLQPWYRRTLRWGQTNITEKDPVRYDIGWWRQQWKRTEVQGVIINAGGIIAYYPSKYPLHQRAEFLGDRDLYGELAKAAHDDGLVVLARMDSNRASEAFYKQHPDWFSVNAEGKPYRAADKYISCVNSPYYDEWIPGILREIIERSKCEGLTDNSWSGLERDSICYCPHCSAKFEAKTGRKLPRKKDWDDPDYRQWIKWSYARRVEIWEINNRTAQASGGPHCLWIGMNSGNVARQSRAFRDLKEICKRAEIMMMDHQARNEATGFQQNGDTGKFIHGLLGWEKLAPESMALYQNGRTSFRVASKPAAEARMWMLEGFAGGIQPWWHHVGAYHEDRRMYRTAEPVMKWHKANERYLVNRKPVASVGVVWSQDNVDFYGRDHAEELTELPYRGVTQALIRARIPYLPVHADHIERDMGGFAALVLPNLAAMSDAQVAAIRRFVAGGGSLVATGVSSLFTEWGDRRPDFALADLFGAHAPAKLPDSAGSHHTYLRLSPELRAKVDGPRAGDEPAPSGDRHPVLRGFDETDILPFGGMLEAMRTEPGVTIPLTFIPPFPIYPPETAWMREPKTGIGGLVLSQRGKARVAYLPADIDRRYSRENLPDHADLLRNLVLWAAGGSVPLAVEGPGLIDCHLYAQEGRLVLHLVNLISAGTWRAPIDEYIAVGPFQVKVRLPAGVKARGVSLLVAGGTVKAQVKDGWAGFEVRSILDHEVAVVA